MKEDKVSKLVDKKIKTLKWNYYLQLNREHKEWANNEKVKLREQQNKITEDFKKAEVEYKARIAELNIKISAINQTPEPMTWEQALNQPVSDEFRMQIEQEVKLELGLVKEQPKSLLTPEQEAQLDQLVKAGELGNGDGKFF